MSTADQVEAVRHLYVDLRTTLVEVGTKLGVSKKAVLRIMQQHGIPRRSCGKRNQSGSANPRWKGSEAGYGALHQRVEKVRGRPAGCERCGKDDPTARYEWANLTGRYDDVDDYERMCVECHRRYDLPRQHPSPKRPGRPRQRIVCVTCGREGNHSGRGRCSTCYTRLRRQGLFAEEDRRTADRIGDQDRSRQPGLFEVAQ